MEILICFIAIIIIIIIIIVKYRSTMILPPRCLFGNIYLFHCFAGISFEQYRQMMKGCAVRTRSPSYDVSTNDSKHGVCFPTLIIFSYLLQVAYSNRDAVYKFVRKVMALPFLPPVHIRPAFAGLRQKSSLEQTTALLKYVEDTWMTSTVWDVSSWSVFGQTVRTNNDCEGWHHRI